ncbi:MAG TPA: MerC domain-containing protein [Saprospiraceae bacterium]|nr:MerC domain-containing protein [Saprospiraceae bacterium]
MRFFGWHIDFLGFSASFACAVHCMALPVLLSLGFLGGAEWLENEAIERFLIIGSIIIASYSIGKSYFREHRNVYPLLWLLVGIAFLIGSLFLHHGSSHYILTAIGGFSIAFAHFVNWKYLTSCKLPALR